MKLNIEFDLDSIIESKLNEAWYDESINTLEDWVKAIIAHKVFKNAEVKGDHAYFEEINSQKNVTAMVEIRDKGSNWAVKVSKPQRDKGTVYKTDVVEKQFPKRNGSKILQSIINIIQKG